MNLSVRLSFGLLMMRVIGLSDTFLWWKKAGEPSKSLPNKSAVFVGFGAGPEENMWSVFYENNIGHAVRLNQTEVVSFGKFYRPPLMELWKECWHQSYSAYSYLASTKIEPIAIHRLDFITYTTQRMGQYVFYKCWWRAMCPTQVDEVEFISADTAAYACLDAGVENVKFQQHGLIRKSVIVPPFHEMKLLTKTEQAYFSKLIPNCEIKLMEQRIKISSHSRKILIASIYDIQSINKEQSRDVIQEITNWAEQNLLNIVIRKHPKERDTFWEDHFPKSIVDTISDSFESALLRHKPMILVTWFSTTLIEALQCNVVPVTISAMSDIHVQDMVLNLGEHCLAWPDDKSLLGDLVNDELTVEAVIARIEQGGGKC